MIAGGVPAGASKPCQGAVLKSLMPASASVGTSGRYGTRSLPEVPRTRTFPPLMYGITVGGVVNMSCTSPDTIAVNAGAPPLNGTETICVLVRILNSSAASAPELLGVANATFSSFGLNFASAINSCTVFALTDALTASSNGWEPAIVTGAKSL